MLREKDRLARPIGVLDSGVGGLTVLKALVKQLPQEDFLYLGDTARTPYGIREEGELRAFVEEMLCYLEGQGVKQVVLACNTITALGPEKLQRQHPFSLIGMSRGVDLLLAASKKKKIAIFATPFTIATDLHRQALLGADAAVQVCPVPCPKFVTLVEGERFASPELSLAIDEYTEPVKKAGADVVGLCCTHFPFLRGQLQAALGPDVAIVDPAEVTAALCQRQLEEEGLLKPPEGRGRVTICCTADLGRVGRLAARMLPLEGCSFKLVTLSSN